MVLGAMIATFVSGFALLLPHEPKPLPPSPYELVDQSPPFNYLVFENGRICVIPFDPSSLQEQRFNRCAARGARS